MDCVKLFSIETNAVYGRYIVAVKDIKEGELILKEPPTILGSTIEGFHVCFRCCESLKTSVQVCKECKVATLCRLDCEGTYHSDFECLALKSSGINVVNLLNDAPMIMPLRCLMLRQYNPNLWEQFMAMESHLDKRKDTPIWKRHKQCVQEPLNSLNLLTQEDLDQDLIQKICGILDVNSFEIRPRDAGSNPLDPKDCLRGLYVQASLMAHDCVGNTQLSVDDDFIMAVHSTRPIASGEIIFFNYGNCLKGTYERRRHLREGKYFDCVCQRCSDPSELGTHMSSIRCNKCKLGFVVPIIPLSDDVYQTSWHCQNCATVYKGALIKTTVDQLRDKMISWDPTNIPQGEELLRKLEMSLSPAHYLILEHKQNMIPLYEHNLYSYRAMELKINKCKDIIKILEVVEPGISRLRGLALFQLHSTQLNLANKLYQTNEISPAKYLTLLNESELNLAMAVKYLLYEPKTTPEGRLTQHAINELKLLRNMIKHVETLCVNKLSEKNDILRNLTNKKKNHY